MMQKPPGIEDIFPDRIVQWNFIQNTAREIFKAYNFHEIIIPLMEYTDVFVRGIGDGTDIVSKEMFTFEDRGGRSLTLRPEGTASVVRAYAENGEYIRLALSKFFYMGSMFRAEKPQKGRLRQFNQLGAELFGSADAYHDFEIISVMDSISKRIGLTNYSLLLNSIGCAECRSQYLEALKKYYSGLTDNLCNDCKSRFSKNTLRLLDCKNESCRKVREGAPIITEFLDDECRAHYELLKKYLKDASINFTEDPYLVRGLDYYTRTTFEFVTNDLGAQNAFAAGGRYDNLVEQFSGKSTPAVGFAAGIERMMLLTQNTIYKPAALDVYIVHTGGATLEKAIALTTELRNMGVSADLDPAGKGFKTQFKRAERDNAQRIIIIGEEELTEEKAKLKDQKTGEQISIPFSEIANTIANK